MKDFFKLIFASCLGVFLASTALLLIGSAVIGSKISDQYAPKTGQISANSVLSLKFDQPIPERTDNVEVTYDTYKKKQTLGLTDIVRLIDNAKDDNNIKGIFLDVSNLQIGQATSSVLRRAINDFKEDGKFVIAFSEYFSQGGFHLASAADKLYVHELGGIDFRGFGVERPFFKDMLDRLGIKMQIYFAGQFKSATEPFRLDKMSKQSKLQTREYLEGMYDVFLDDVAASRGIPKEKLREMANSFAVRNAQDAVDLGLVDGTAYKDQAINEIRSRIGLDKNETVSEVKLSKYAYGRLSRGKFSVSDKIAIVYAEGELVNGKGKDGNIGGERYRKMVSKIRKDANVKAIVVRVNSPGGSALASDIIWRELKLAREDGIPVYVSMGDFAASGGYYIACHADSIFAEANTITGSIGVFGMIPSMEKMFKEKFGINYDTVKTTQYANGISLFRDIAEDEGKIIQTSIEEMYETFLKRVSDGRKMSRDEVHEIAQGRVWTGKKALELGLVDAIGGLDEAVMAAANSSGLDDYRIVEYPKVKKPIEKLMDKLYNLEDAKVTISTDLDEFYPMYKELIQIKNMKGPQARLPFWLKYN